MREPSITWIEMEQWPRKTHFQSFTGFSKCMIHTTVRLNMSDFYSFCKKSGHRFFPAMIVAVAEIANRIPEFRMVLTPEKRLGYWDFVSPVYSIWHDDDKTFSSICTEYSEDHEAMYQAIIRDMEKYKDRKGHIVSPIPQNILPTSCEPDLDFSSFLVQPCGDVVESGLVMPTIIWGKMTEADGKRTMPVSVSINHVAADGYHVSRFFTQLQELCDNQGLF